MLPFQAYNRTPRAPLSLFIDRVWQIYGVTPYTKEKVLPNGVLELIFNFGPYHRVLRGVNGANCTTYKRCWVAGLQSHDLLIEAVGETMLLGVRFRPGGAYAFFGFPIAELTDEVVESDLLKAPWILETHDRLLGAQSPEQRFDIVERALLAHLYRVDMSPMPCVDFAVREIERSHGAATIKEICERAGVTNKHLVEQFKKRVGLSPKLLARVRRFQRALGQARVLSSVDWTEVAHASGYYDQAHFNHEFKRFTGSTPSEYLASRSHDGEHIIVG